MELFQDRRRCRTRDNDNMNIAAELPEPEDDIATFRREILNYIDVFKGELAQNGDWIVANISTNSVSISGVGVVSGIDKDDHADRRSPILFRSKAIDDRTA
jgi:hypothetical protein